MKPDIIVYDINLSRVGVLDDYAELTASRAWRETGTATVTINRNIPNATLLTEGAILIIGDDPRDSFKVVSLQDSIDSDGKVSQMLVATCEDLRCILKQRMIMDLNTDGIYTDSNPAETVIKNLVTTQCVSSSDIARNFPDLVVATDQARGADAVISTKYTSVYDACVSVSKQSNIGWFIYPNIATGEYILDCAVGVDRSTSVFFDYNFESLQSADYTEDIRSYRNLAYVGGSGTGIDREIYTGYTNPTEPSGFERFETFIDAGNLNTEAELQARAEGALEELQVSSSVSMDGLQKSPFVYKENYNCGDVVTVRFNDHTIQVRLYVVSESWMPGEYDIGFEVGKPRPDIGTQIGQISSSIYNNATGSEAGTNNTGMKQGILTISLVSGFTMNAGECIFNILLFTGTLTQDVNAVLYINTATLIGRKSYHLIFTATADTTPRIVTIKTAETGKSTVQVAIPVSNSGFYIDVVVDGAGNVYKQIAVYSEESGNAGTATKLATARKINGVDFDGSANITVADSTKAPTSHASPATTYGVSSEANYGHAKASAVAGTANGTASKGTTPTVFAQSDHVHPLQTSVSGNAGTATKLATARNISISDADGTNEGTAVPVDGSENKTLKLPSTIKATLAGKSKDSYPIPTDAVLQYSFDEIKQLPDNPTGTVYKKDNDWTTVDGWATGSATASIVENKLSILSSATNTAYILRGMTATNKRVRVYLKRSNAGEVHLYGTIGGVFTLLGKRTIEANMYYTIDGYINGTTTNVQVYFIGLTSGNTAIVQTVYVGDGSYLEPVIDNSYSESHATNAGVIPVDGVCGKAGYFNNSYMIAPRQALGDDITIYFWAKFDALGTQTIVQSRTVVGKGLSVLQLENLYRIDWRDNVLRFYGYTPPINTWHHVCMKMNSTTAVLKINGETKVTLTGTYGTTQNLASFIWSGMSGTGGTLSGNILTGALDGLKIVPRYTTDDEDTGEYKARANLPKFYTYERYLIENLP